MDNQTLKRQIEEQLHRTATSIRPLSGGMIGQVYRIDLADGKPIVAKAGPPSAKLNIEGYMLRYLGEHSNLPVPEVLYADDMLLLMTLIEGESRLGASEQENAAELLAELHSVTQPRYGLERDTLIGPLHQPNPLYDSWIAFFREHRLRYMAKLAHDDGSLPSDLYKRILTFSDELENWLIEPEHPSLIHGDIWTTNVLTQNGRVTGFIDPAIYYGDAEIELAYTTLFGTFGQTFSSPFFERYTSLRPLADGFFEERRDIYNLYPLLVHVRLFGGGYVSSVDTTLHKYGF